MRPLSFATMVFAAAVAIATLPVGDAARADDGPGSLAQVQGGFRWTRGSIAFDLRDRHGQWSADEARMVADVLDPLPDVYLGKVVAGGVRTLYRDSALPQAPWNVLLHPPETRSGVAVPAAPWRFIAFGDRTFSRGPEKCARTVVHELGHCVQWTISGAATITTGTPGFTGISWTTGVPTVGLKSWNGFPSTYARRNHMEDFAEACEWYWLAPFELYRASPAKYAYVRNHVFEGVFPPPSVRSAEMQAIDRVGPTISSLSDARAAPGAVVHVRGEHFMAATDGGFNQVHIRGRRALHVPVTRSQLYCFVPAIGDGSAPLTVTTQDGRSPAAGFSVKRPFWMFW
jgi:hypothetical protein